MAWFALFSPLFFFSKNWISNLFPPPPTYETPSPFLSLKKKLGRSLKCKTAQFFSKTFSLFFSLRNSLPALGVGVLYSFVSVLPVANINPVCSKETKKSFAVFVWICPGVGGDGFWTRISGREWLHVMATTLCEVVVSSSCEWSYLWDSRRHTYIVVLHTLCFNMVTRVPVVIELSTASSTEGWKFKWRTTARTWSKSNTFHNVTSTLAPHNLLQLNIRHFKTPLHPLADLSELYIPLHA